MKSLSIIITLFVLLHTIRADKEYVIDMDLPPVERYAEIAKDHREHMMEVFEALKQGVPKSTWDLVAGTFRTVAVKKYKEYTEEFGGIGQLTNLSATDVYVLNCFYEMSAMCTSIVARDKNNKLILARNFDFGFKPVIRKMHINVVYKRQGKEVARCGNIAGYVGALTCMRLKAFALAMNGRVQGNFQEFVMRLRQGWIPTTWMLREAVLNAENYEAAVKMVRGRRTVSASYVTIVGTKENEGTVITRNRDRPVNIRKLSKDTWFIAQCNADLGSGDDRTQWANEQMAKLGQSNASLEAVSYTHLTLPTNREV
eukprot:TRINITY_DN1353_c0_g1_i2.p1 TRINITY_DN1353_c0_g1~~TRINITY_DN1353_c0_g1_i2.p1  ORF type:complete len:313 (+),score=60.08 TRINITY_DN1353_c0_g1_i2:238-1176(+)